METPTHTVTVLGTGMMGSAVVRALCRAGLAVTVWNRTRSRAEPLAEHGAVIVDDVAPATEEGAVPLRVVRFRHRGAGLGGRGHAGALGDGRRQGGIPEPPHIGGIRQRAFEHGFDRSRQKGR